MTGLLIDFNQSTDLLLPLAETELDQAWGNSQKFSSKSLRWKAYLNRLCLNNFLQWLQNEEEINASAWPDVDSLAQFWEVVDGTPLQIGDRRLVIIVSDAVDTEELRVPQEWVDSPALAADYFVAAQVDLEAELIRIWGYTTHVKLKEQGQFSQSDRSYVLPSHALYPDVTILGIARKFCPAEVTQADITDISALSLDRAETLVEQLGTPTCITPRLLVPFSEWSALLSHSNLRRMLYERRVPVQPEIIPVMLGLSQWFENLFSSEWQPLELVVATPGSRSTPKENSEFPVQQPARTPTIARARPFDFGLDQAVALVLYLTLFNETDFKVVLEVLPLVGSTTLPEGLRLTLLDDSGNTIEEAEAEQLAIEFIADVGTQFSVCLNLQDRTICETLVI